MANNSTTDTHVWKSIPVGGKSIGDLLKELTDKNFKLCDYEKKLMMIYKQSNTLVKPRKVDFTKKSLKEFGFTGTTFEDLLGFFMEHPIFELCQPEDDCYLRMAYTSQPKGELVRSAVSVIAAPDGRSFVPYLAHGVDGLWLSCLPFDPSRDTSPDALWFARIRK